jgi:AraC-like DNA-binding protein
MSIDSFKIPEQALRLEFATPGFCETFPDGLTHEKTAPNTIVAQPYVGRYEITCQGRVEIIRPGEVFITGANLPLRIVHLGDPRKKFQMKARWLHFHFSLHDTIDFTSLFDLPLRAGPPESNVLGGIIKRLLNPPPDAAGLMQVVERVALAFEALRILCGLGQMKAGALESLEQSKRLQPVLAHMKLNLHRAISIEELARQAHMSPATLHRVFDRSFGISPQRYLKRLRLAIAQRSLVATDWPLAAVAEQTGFATSFHFSREFKKETGLAPSEFRRQHWQMRL